MQVEDAFAPGQFPLLGERHVSKANPPASRKRILFVDDEPRVLEGLKRMLYSLRKQWQMVFVSNGRDALRLLAESEFDVLITDMRMPEMTGPELLAQVIKEFPPVGRIVLSGTTDSETNLSSVSLAHQYLTKPCDAKLLRAPETPNSDW